MNFNFGEVLTRAWQIIWKHKVLWIFGILASCGRGGGGGGGNTGFDTQGPDIQLPPQLIRFSQWVEENAVTFVVLLCVSVILIWLVAKAIGAVGKIGLIRGTAQVDGGTERLIFAELFSESMPYFRRMFALSVLIELPLIILGLLGAVIAIGLFLPLGLGSIDTAVPSILSAFLLFGVCMCLFIPIMIVVYMIAHQAERAIVFEDLNVLASLSRGWDVFRNNLGPIIVMAIILGVIGFVVGIVIAIPIFITVFPFMAIYLAGNQSSIPLVLMAVCICFYIPVALLLQGIVAAYTESAWTLTYIRLVKPQDNAPVTIEANA